MGYWHASMWPAGGRCVAKSSSSPNADDDSELARLTPVKDLGFLFRVRFIYSIYVRFALIVGY
jgi:hypothetical protein